MLFLQYINDIPNNGVCNIVIYSNDTTLYFHCDQASKLESNLGDAVGWGRRWLVAFNSGKTQLYLVGQIFLVPLMWNCLFIQNWIGAVRLSLLLRMPHRKLKHWCSISFFLLRLLFTSINLLCNLVWISAVISLLRASIPSWTC